MTKTSTWLLSYLIWIALMIFAAIAAWRMHYAVIHLTERLVESPWRPTDWHSGSVAQVARLSIFALGSIWLIYILWLEYALRQSVLQKRLPRSSTINFAILFVVTALSIAAMQL